MEERMMRLLGQFEELTATNAELMARLKKLEEEKLSAMAQSKMAVEEEPAKKQVEEKGTVADALASAFEKTTAMQLHPKLQSLQRADIKKFRSAWLQYEKQVAERSRCKLQVVIDSELVETILSANKLEMKEWEQLSDSKAMDVLFETWRVASATDFETRLKESTFVMQASCDIPDLAAYNREWDTDLKFAGLQYLKPAFSKRRLAKLYCAGLKPVELATYVLTNEPESVEDAKQQAFDALPLIRLQIKAKEVVTKVRERDLTSVVGGAPVNGMVSTSHGRS
jgi:hypothetical protein